MTLLLILAALTQWVPEEIPEPVQRFDNGGLLAPEPKGVASLTVVMWR